MGTAVNISARQKRGALNLLVGCGGARRGERLLIAHEPPGLRYYDPGLLPLMVAVARDLGLHVETLDVGFQPEAPKLTPNLVSQMARADLTLFLARLGDQLRFSLVEMGRTVICYAVTPDLLGGSFGTAPHRVMVALKDLVNAHIASARRVRVTCAAGTDFSGQPNMSGGTDTTIRRFPMSVFQPVPAAAFSGRVALPGFLAGTGSRYYRDFMVHFDGPVTARFHMGRLTGFDGATRDVTRAERHYDRIARAFGIERNAVHSWHAGIHPGCGFPWRASTSIERWSGVAFGNPRVLHLHTCGDEAPGEIGWNVIDATVTVDGVNLWEDGRFHPERVAGGAALLRQAPEVATLFKNPERSIGLEVNAVVVPAA